ncbi:cytochrome c5 family protein [Halopseudomonas nanhaiensis]|uniref:c-type cytochrome n=1 Tax=Halopseudomonas nanhaiensis TaxID=2830842 RepID=UPI001CBACC04|nr:c-type cytochrome [Halopseudomonas nanhaiensis]UAW98512.1 cytochrome c5 family protein [Halopseudomonas nanhaiensis]
MTTVKKLLAASAALLALAAGSAFAATDEAIAERLKPYGDVCYVGQPCAEEAGPSTAGASGGGARSGEEVYGKFCTACHGGGVLGAPKTGDSAAWESRLANHNGSLDELTQSAITGIGAMPPKGTCADCSDEEIKLAIQHMSGLE